jgi:hypothetical protein
MGTPVWFLLSYSAKMRWEPTHREGEMPFLTVDYDRFRRAILPARRK